MSAILQPRPKVKTVVLTGLRPMWVSDQGETGYISKRSVFKFRDLLYFFFCFPFFMALNPRISPIVSKLVAGLCRNSVVD